MVPGPLLQGGQNLLLALGQNPAGPLAIIPIWREQLIEQALVRRTHQLRPWQQRPPFGRHSPDAPTLVVASRITKVNFAMLDDRVGPIGNVKRPIRAYLYVDWSEGHIGAPDQIGHLAGHVS